MPADPMVVLAIDPGLDSGWAIAHHEGQVLRSGVARDALARQGVCYVVRDLLDSLLAAGREPMLVVVMERWGAGFRNMNAILGLGRSVGQWLESLELHLGVREADVIRVTPMTWRNALFESVELKQAGKAGLKRLACQYTGLRDHNEADAGCMAMWGMLAPECLEQAGLA